jgi:hypothetical protein
MSKKFSVAMIVAGLASLGVSGMAMANPTLTITAPNATPLVYASPTSFFVKDGFTVGDLTGTTTGTSVYGSGSTNSEISFASINLKNNGSSTEKFTIDITDPAFTANGTLNNETYTAVETFGGEVSNGTADMTFTTTASSSVNSSAATVVQTQTITGTSLGAASFGTPQGSSSPTLVLSPGQSFTIDSNLTFTLTPGTSVSLNVGNLNDNGYSEVIPTGNVTPEPTSAAIAMGGMLPLFFLKRRKMS